MINLVNLDLIPCPLGSPLSCLASLSHADDDVRPWCHSVTRKMLTTSYRFITSKSVMLMWQSSRYYDKAGIISSSWLMIRDSMKRT